MVTEKDIDSDQIAHGKSLSSTTMFRRSCLEISRNNNAMVLNENDIGQEEEREW